MTETVESKLINDYLLTFGVNLFGQAKFRLAFTEDLTELRTGEYNEYHGNLFLRRKVGTLRVPKYNYLRERWIIEKWFPPEMTINPELPESRQGDYSIIYAFDCEGVALPLNKRVVEIIMQAQMNVEKSKLRQLTDSRNRIEEKDKQIEKLDDEIIGEDTPLITQLHLGEAVFIDSSRSCNVK